MDIKSFLSEAFSARILLLILMNTQSESKIEWMLLVYLSSQRLNCALKFQFPSFKVITKTSHCNFAHIVIKSDPERERERKNLIQFDSNELLCSECNARDENYFFIIQND